MRANVASSIYPMASYKTVGDLQVECRAACQGDEADLEAVIRQAAVCRSISVGDGYDVVFQHSPPDDDEIFHAFWGILSDPSGVVPSVSCCELMRTKYRLQEVAFASMFYKRQLPDLSVTQWFVTTFPQKPERLGRIYRNMQHAGHVDVCAWLAAAHPECLSD